MRMPRRALIVLLLVSGLASAKGQEWRPAEVGDRLHERIETRTRDTTTVIEVVREVTSATGGVIVRELAQVQRFSSRRNGALVDSAERVAVRVGHDPDGTTVVVAAPILIAGVRFPREDLTEEAERALERVLARPPRRELLTAAAPLKRRADAGWLRGVVPLEPESLDLVAGTIEIAADPDGGRLEVHGAGDMASGAAAIVVSLRCGGAPSARSAISKGH